MGIIEELEENKSFDEAQSVSEVFEEEEMREENESDLLDQDAEKEDQQREEGEEDSMDSYTQIVMKLYNEYVKECKEPEAMEEVPRKAIEMALKETQEEYEMHVMEGVEEQGNEVEFVTVVDGFQESLEKFVKYGKTDRKWSYMRRSIIAYFKSNTLHSFFPNSRCDAVQDRKNPKYINYLCTRIRKLKCSPSSLHRLCELILHPTHYCSSIEELMSEFKQVSRNLKIPKRKKQTKKVKVNGRLQENKESGKEQSTQLITTAEEQCSGESTPKKSPLLAVQAATVNVNNDTTGNNASLDGNDLVLADVKKNAPFYGSKAVSTKTQLSFLDSKSESVATQTSNDFAFTQEEKSLSSVPFTQETDVDVTANRKRGIAVTLPKQK